MNHKFIGLIKESTALGGKYKGINEDGSIEYLDEHQAEEIKHLLIVKKSIHKKKPTIDMFKRTG